MPLILAIEPDKRQSTQLAGIVKQLHAELVHRPDALAALAALHGRVPDLVLTSSLISPRDDAALAAHLRDLGTAAAHVQTVTIPLLGSAPPKRAKVGMLAAWRREKPQEAMTDGCAPDVFAEQIRQYLETADEQKATAATRVVAAPESALEEPEAVIDTIAAPVAEIDTFEPIELEPMPFEAAVEQVEAIETVEAVEAVEATVAIEAAPVVEFEEQPAPVAEWEAEPEPEALVADEPAGLPLSQLLQMVSATAVVEAPLEADEPRAETDEPLVALADAPVAEDVTREFVEAIAETAPAVDDADEPFEVPAAPVGDFGDLYVDPVAAQALDELSRQAPAASLADGIPAEAPVPVVEMHAFQNLDSIASELAAGPSKRRESLDDLASLFAAAPATKAAAAPELFAAPLQAEHSAFASLFAEPVAVRPSTPIEVPGIDPSLFAPAPELFVPADAPEPEVVAVGAARVEELFAAPVVPDALFAQPLEVAPVVEELAEPELEPEPAMAVAEPELVMAAEPEPAPVFVAAPEPVAAIEPEPIVVAAPEPVLALEPEPVVVAAPELVAATEPVVAPEPVENEPLMAFEPVLFEPAMFEAAEEPVAVAAAPAFDDEVALDVDTFEVPPVAPAEASRFSFTFVDGFGDAWSDFEVPSLAAMAADLGLSEQAPLDPYAVTHAPTVAAPTPAVAESLIEAAAAPMLDQEALSLIGDAARKVSLDAMVIEEFERGYAGRRQKKLKKKAHAGATQVAPVAERPAAKPTKRPVQDEWGMFDPEQCGFAALEDEEAQETRPASGTRVRVISY
jgi:hypothetical protein